MQGRKQLGLVVATIAIAGLLGVAPATASAATFTVNQTGDQADASVGNGACDWDTATSGNQCTLRAAVDEADGNTAGSNDTIKFSSGIEGMTITLASVIVIDTELTIDGGDCGDETISHKPCVGIDAGDLGSDALDVNLGVHGVDIRGLAIGGATSGARGIFGGGDALTVKGSWLGFDVDGNSNANSAGVQLFGSSSVIGGTTGAERNVIGNADRGVQILDGDSNKIRGNYIGVEPDGVTAATIAFNGVEISGSSTGPDDATGNVIGSTVSSSEASTTKCDGGCNVIANGSNGIDLRIDSGPNRAARDTTIKGNFIGLDKTGATAAVNTAVGIYAATGADGTTIGGDSSADRNFITGGANSVFSNGADLLMKRNFIGLNSAGTAAVDPGSFGAAIADGTVSRNRFAVGDGNFGMDVAGPVRVVRNKFGLNKDGTDLPDAGARGIRVIGSNAVIGEPGAGNTIGNLASAPCSTCAAIWLTGGGSDSTKIQGNYIGVDSAGTSHPNAGAGIVLEDGNSSGADDNVIGGTSSGTENVISNSGDDAIRIQRNVDASSGNQIKRNRGKSNGSTANDLFIDLGDNGAGNNDGLIQDGIEAPEIADGDPGDATRTHAEGINAEAGGTIYIFRTSAAATFSPNRINAFVDTATVSGTGDWSANFAQIPSGQRLTALQIDASGNASELALAIAP